MSAAIERSPLFQQLPGHEQVAIRTVMQIAASYGHGNLIAWLATEWACRLRDGGLKEVVAIEHVSNRTPYPLPPAV